MQENRNTDTDKISKLAILSLALALSSILLGYYGGILAIITGIGAIIDIKRRKHKIKGAKIAYTGIILGLIFTIIGLYVCLVLNVKK